MTIYRAVISYDGTGYAGFQRQASSTPTIQGTLEDALAHVTGQTITVTGAGRTDAGVHAAGQVIAFAASWRHTAEDLWRAANAALPDTIAVLSLGEADEGFHPRYAARSRVYEYTLYSAPVRQPLLNKYAWHVRGLLDHQAMQQAASSLVGVHDFASFGQPPQGDVTVREVLQSVIEAVPGGPANAQLLHYTIEANAFLYRMVRRIVGALVRVGSGNLTLEAFEAAFEAADGTWPSLTAPAHGLSLVKVNY